ncbi:AEC family transporter [Streptococcus uberis]|nr:AEC family transporter [Streptococcus uberis]MCK1210665.1 AEC family transporter [Streptococcus uberis]MCK1258569.1 AEC family transporter [Streptococcus uberis]
MQAFNTLAPVFFMLILGYMARQKEWVGTEAKNGTNTIIFTILFPILIFHLMMNAEMKMSTVPVILYTLIAFILAVFTGQLLKGFIGLERSHFAKYLLPTVEGGSVALPLYLSIVGVSSNTVIFDIAGSVTAFLILPILVSKAAASQTNKRDLVISIIKHPFVLAIVFGLLANQLQLPQLIAKSPFAPAYDGIISRATAPIGGLILFILGYDLKIDLSTIKPLLKLLLVRVTFYMLTILGFFLLFPHFMRNHDFKLAVLIYFMCPTGFAIPSIISPVFQSEEDEMFSATFISLSLIVTLIVYTNIVIFMA